MELRTPEEEKQYREIIDWAIANRREQAPEDANEFDIYADMHYNIYMFIKGEWVNVGLNVTPLSNDMI